MFCCSDLKFFINSTSISYNSSIRRYGIHYKLEAGGGVQTMYYCPWCGNKLPKVLNEEFSYVMFDELDLDDYDDPRFPEELKTDEWWIKRGL